MYMEDIKFFNVFGSRKLRLAAVLTVFILSAGFTKVHAQVDIDRYSGTDRYETAAKVCQDGWKESSDYAVLVNGENFPDALSAAPLAKKYDAPILLMGNDSLSPYTSVELSRLNVKNAFIVGGKGVISQSVEDAVKSRGIKVTRLGGSDRYETSIEVAKKLGNANQIAVVNGDNFYDGISMAPIAALKGMPIVLTTRDNIPDSTAKFLNGKKKADAVYVIGGQTQISDDILKVIPQCKRIGDGDIFSRNIDIIDAFKSELNTSTVYIASDRAFPDSLVASAIASRTASPIVFVDDYVPNAIYNFLKSEIVSNMKILGGGGSVSYSIENELKSIPLSVSYVNNFTDTIWQNDKYIPRSTVLVTADAGVVKDVPVTWNLSKINTSNPGKFVLYGKIEGSDKQVTATLIVKPIPVEIEDVSKEIYSGNNYTLPKTVKAKMSDGDTKNVEVTWEYGEQNTKDSGIYTFYGTVEKYSKKVKLTLTVI
jgi:putative cell wall-binding protein